MTESQFQAKLLKALRQHTALKDAVIFKHSDRINGGIPDVSITVNGNTSWFELKVAPNELSKLQAFYLTALGRRAFLVTGYKTPVVGSGMVSIDSWYYGTIALAANRIAELCTQ